MEIQIIIIDDSQKILEDPLVWSLKETFGESNIHCFLTPDNGLQFIRDNLDKNIIVLLDIDFPENQMNGHKVLAEMTNISKLIPVILWSGIDKEKKEKFSDFINNGAFGFIDKTSSTKEAMEKVNKAVSFLDFSLDNAIEDWIIENEEDKDKPVYLTSNGKSYTLNDILNEIRMQTDVGKEFSKKLNKLTIDLLLRNKESL